MKAIAIFLKELVDLLRDRRALLSAFAYVAFGPIALLVTVNLLADQSREGSLSPIRFCNAESDVLFAHLTASGVIFDSAASVCIDVAADFEQQLSSGRTTRVDVYANLSASETTVQKVEQALARLSSALGAQRLLARGLSPSLSTPLDIDLHNTSRVSRRADVVTKILVILFVMAPFFVAVAAAADMTAGERERGALEPLLSTPVSAFSIVVGKWLAAAALNLAGTAACVVAGLALLRYSALAEIGIRLETGLNAGLVAVLYLTPLTLLSAAIQLAIGLWSKNFKDAQSYLMLLSFAPAIVGFMMTGEYLAKAAHWPVVWEMNALQVPLLQSASPAVAFSAIVQVELGLTFVVLVLCALRIRSEAILSKA